MAEELIGKTMGKYELIERIGRGGMAEVYKAYHANLDRYVALKVLHPFLGEDPEFKDRFEREARNVARLRHPNIVQAYDFDFDAGRDLYYMVMEYVDGPTLRAHLMQRKLEGIQFAIDDAIRITRDMASALAYAHKQSMIHRDIKPSNIMIDIDDRVVLTDFGIARIVSGPNMTASGSMVGTPAYMAPEQGLGQPGDNRSDIYSLGIVLYQLVTGTIPYDADTPIAVILKHVNDPLPAPRDLNPDIPRGLELVIYKALAKSPDERYHSAEEMITHLDNLEQAASSITVPTTSTLGPLTGDLSGVISAPSGDAIRTGPSGCLNWLILLVLSLAALAGGAYLSFTGILHEYVPFVPAAEIVLTNTPVHTPTFAVTAGPEEPAGAELEATAIAQTVEALNALVDTPNIPTTPDMTATVLACDYDYEIISQSPENASGYPELTTLTKTITIINDSLCPLDDDTQFIFSDGLHLEGPDFVEFTAELAPGEEVTLELELRTPALDPINPVVASTWILVLPDGTQVGRPLTFELTILPSDG